MRLVDIIGKATFTGKFIGIKFRKMDGKIRTLSCKTSPDSFNRIEKGLLTVLDARTGTWKSMHVRNILEIRVEGERFLNSIETNRVIGGGK